MEDDFGLVALLGGKYLVGFGGGDGEGSFDCGELGFVDEAGGVSIVVGDGGGSRGGLRRVGDKADVDSFSGHEACYVFASLFLESVPNSSYYTLKNPQNSIQHCQSS